MTTPGLIDVHAHFFTERSGRADWERVNAARLEVCHAIGVTHQVASVLGTWGATSPTYFPSPADLTHANAWLRDFAARTPGVLGYCAVNPNYPDHARDEMERGLAEGMVGLKLAASRRADDPQVDPVVAWAADHAWPVLHHIWQDRRRDWPGQEASDAGELATLAARHPSAKLILAHIGGGGDWGPSLRVLRHQPNIWVDLSGSGVDSGMLESVLESVEPTQILWGCDVTIDTGLAKLRYLESLGLPPPTLEGIRATNARALFPPGAFAV